jgi:NADPH-dependent glutamate synthase beta subunit-like oxidoreductase
MTTTAAREPELVWEPATAAEERSRLEGLADDILERCRGEGPANCVGRCPLHVDARGYVQLTKKGQYREALQLVRQQLPFPGVLGYVCAHPCERHCKRIDDDSPIRVRDIKRFLAEWEPGEPQHLLDRQPATGKKVAVVGAGPGGLLAAHDLARRGHDVTMIEREEAIGGCLRYKLPDWRLPRPVLERDLSVIEALGIDVRTNTALGDDVALAELRESYDAVILEPGFEGMEPILQAEPELARTTRGTLAVDPITGETSLPGVYAGGDAVSGPATVIDALAGGRRAAESVHRSLVGEDPRTNREPVGPARLLWRLDVSEAERQRRERAPVMLKPFNPPMTEAEAREEGERCLDCECGLCVQDCEFLAKHCDSPKDLARRVKEGLEPPPTREMIYSCNLCELCAHVCPEDLDTGEMLIAARREAVSRGLGPLPSHKGMVGYWKAGVSSWFTLVMPEPGRQRSKRLFFTGCALPATAPRHTLTVYDQLRRHYPGTGVMMWCCGAPVDMIGMEEEFASTREQILREAEKVGAEELVAACPDCVHILKSHVPELAVSTIWERLADSWSPPRMLEGMEVAIHDSCKARHEMGIHQAVRRLVDKGGGMVRDIDYAGEKARCCGFGGMIYAVDGDLTKRIASRRGDESPLPMVTYCSGCRISLTSAGKPSLHLLDLLLSKDPQQAIARKPPGSLPRYATRLRTKWAFKRLRPLPAE